MAEETEIKLYAEMTAEDKRVPKEGVPILAVFWNPKTEAFHFVGYEALTILLKSGVSVEEYLSAKVETVRKLLVGVH